jgi:hypothetical protein
MTAPLSKGRQSDLVLPTPPTVAEIEPLSSAGFAVHWLREKSKAPIEAGWTSVPRYTPDELRQSYRDGANAGLRLGAPSDLGGGLRVYAFDLDIRKSELADEAHDALREFLPEYDTLPTVASGSGGLSRHYYFLSDGLFASKKLAHSAESFVGEDGRKHWAWEIELFGTGKQVAIPPSIHPDTGKPYRWLRRFDFDLLDMGLGPVVSAERVGQWARVRGVEPVDDDDLIGLARATPTDLTPDEVRRTLADLPAKDWCEDRDGWLQVGMALHHQFEGKAQGYRIWTEWSKGSEKFNEKDQARVWSSFDGKPNGVTFKTIIKAASDAKLRAADKTLTAYDPDTDDLIGPTLSLRKHPTSGAVIPDRSNLEIALTTRSILKGALRVDEFRSNLMIDLGEGWREYGDCDQAAICLRLERFHGFASIPAALAKEMIALVGKRHTFDSGNEWLAAQSWDGVSRMASFWPNYFGSDDTPYTRACGEYVWSALAGRILEPGIKADMSPVLIGRQGAGKSRGIAAMAPFPDLATSLTFRDPESEKTRKILGHVVVELDELSGLRNSEIEAVKSWMSRPVEHWTPKYIERAVKYPRRCLFFGSTNEGEFLSDSTGARRFLPLRVGEHGAIDVDAIVRDAAQLWAEGATVFRAKGIQWRDAEQLARAVHAEHSVSDPWEILIAKFLAEDSDEVAGGGERPSWRSIADIAFGALNLDRSRLNSGIARRISPILKKMGWTQGFARIEGQNTRVWFDPCQA